MRLSDWDARKNKIIFEMIEMRKGKMIRQRQVRMKKTKEKTGLLGSERQKGNSMKKCWAKQRDGERVWWRRWENENWSRELLGVWKRREEREKDREREVERERERKWGREERCNWEEKLQLGILNWFDQSLIAVALTQVWIQSDRSLKAVSSLKPCSDTWRYAMSEPLIISIHATRSSACGQ